MNKTPQQPQDEKEKKKKRGFFIIFTFGLSIALLLGSLFLSPSTTSSSSGSSPSQTTSIDSSTSSTTPTSSYVSSSSDVTSSSESSSSSETSSSDASSSTPSSSEPTSEPIGGPRLSQLDDLQRLVVSLKNNNIEYFLWQDATHLLITAFNGNTLIYTTSIGTIANHFLNAPWVVAFNDGILFTTAGPMSPPPNFAAPSLTTFYYSPSGLEETLLDTNIVLSEGAFATQPQHVVKIVNAVPELHIMSGPTTDTVKVMDLDPDYAIYDLISDQFRNVQSGSIVNLGQMFAVSAVDFNNNGFPVTIIYSILTLEPIYTLRFGNPNVITTVTQNAIFEYALGQGTVKIILPDGTTITLNNVIANPLKTHRGYLIGESMTGNVHFYVDGILNTTFPSSQFSVMSDDAENGLAFVIKDMETNSFTLHDYTPENGLTSSDAYPYEFGYTNITPNSRGFIRYESLEQDSGDPITTYIRYNQGWEIYHAYGEVANYARGHVVHDDVPYVIDFVPITNDNRDNVEIKIYNGLDTSNDVRSVFVNNLNVSGLSIAGFAGPYMLLQVSSLTSSFSVGLIVDLTTGALEQLPEGISYLTPGLNEPFSEHIYLDGTTIHAYGRGGAFSVDMTDVTNTFATNTGDINSQTEYMNLLMYNDVYGENDDLVLLAINPFPNTDFMHELKFLRGDLSKGFSQLTNLVSINVNTNFITTHQFIIQPNAIYAVLDFGNGFVTVYGPSLPENYYVQNGVYVMITDTLEETPTTYTVAERVSLIQN
jgi:hypothetical protein